MAVEDEERRESIGCTVGTSLGLLVLFMLLGSPFLLLRGCALGAEQADAIMARNFVEGRAPFGLELVEASILPANERVLRFGRPAEAVPADPRAPDELVLVLAPKTARIRRFFELDTTTGEEASEKLVEWREAADEAWTTPLDGGELTWDEWRADFLMQRSFREGGGFRDGAVIDLSRPKDPRALFVLWPAGVEGHRADVLRAVRAVRIE